MPVANAAQQGFELANGFVVPMASSANMVSHLARAAHEQSQVARALAASTREPGAPVRFEEDEEALLAVAMAVGLACKQKAWPGDFLQSVTWHCPHVSIMHLQSIMRT